VLGQFVTSRHWQIAVAESLTGGQRAYNLFDVSMSAYPKMSCTSMSLAPAAHSNAAAL
jgi:nicotinamide mononucleotide (NMN) deamidase PncC